jgi:hypothetical protein
MIEREQLIERIARALADSQARDDEGQFPRLFELIDFSGENKTWTVLREAAVAALEVIERDTSLGRG